MFFWQINNINKNLKEENNSYATEYKNKFYHMTI